MGLAGGAWFLTSGCVVYSLATRPGTLPGAAWLAWSGIFTVSAAWVALLYALLLFPTGRLPSPRWKPLAWAFGGFVAVTLIVEVFRPGVIPGMPVPVRNPTGMERAGGVIAVSDLVRPLLSFPLLLGMAVSVIARFLRAQGEERQQLKWLALAASILATIVVLGLLDTAFLNGGLGGKYADVPAILGIGAVPVAVGVAVLRYRLYDIDLIIRRTLVYGVLTGILAFLYFSAVALLQFVSRALTDGGAQQP